MDNTERNKEKAAALPPSLPVSEQALPQNTDFNRSALGNLLKAPMRLIRRIDEDDSLPALTVQLFFWGLAFHAAYGFAMALFDSAGVAFVTAGKAPLIAFCSVLLCMPSLYVFSCVAGLPITITQSFALAGATLAMTGLLLLGLTPVTWLFSVSTDSLPFVVIINVLAWAVAVSFAFRFFGVLNRSGAKKKTGGLKWWLVIYVIVSLQMATTMRPLLSEAEQGWQMQQKKFFLAHFRDSIARTRRNSVEPAKEQ